jgi:hypothetical protein
VVICFTCQRHKFLLPQFHETAESTSYLPTAHSGQACAVHFAHLNSNLHILKVDFYGFHFTDEESKTHKGDLLKKGVSGTARSV